MCYPLHVSIAYIDEGSRIIQPSDIFQVVCPPLEDNGLLWLSFVCISRYYGEMPVRFSCGVRDDLVRSYNTPHLLEGRKLTS